MTPFSSASGAPVLAAFLGSLVEFVEALTIVLAVGSVRGWRAALVGAAAALGLLVGVVGLFYGSVAALPIAPLRLAIGILTLLFGLRWLRKAILRYGGYIPLHDEARIYAKTTERIRGASAAPTRASRPFLDPIAFLTSFKVVLLEGTEVVFIVIAVASNTGAWAAATVGALGALLVVAAAGLALHRPLARVPENSLKFGVGVLLAGLGSFWVGEGLGIEWPGADAAIPVLVAGFLALGLGLGASLHALGARTKAPVGGAATQRSAPTPTAAPPTPTAATHATPTPATLAPGERGWLVGALGIAIDLFIDDRALALGVSAWLVLLWFAHARAGAQLPWAVFIAGLVSVLTYSTLRAASTLRGPARV
jgi:uncharacterized membrane protein